VTLSSKIDISNDNRPKITLMGTTLYVVSIEDGTGDIEVYSAAAGASPSFSSHSTAIAGAGFYDPTIVGDGTDLYVITAPWDSGDDRQYMVQAKYSGGSWSTAKSVSYGGYGTTYWWEYWPILFYDGSDVWVFFTTETSSPVFSDGEIAHIKMDWDLGNDHYMYVQNAIDQAVASDVIEVAAGTYAERLNISKSLDLRGAQYGVDPTPGGARTNPANESIVTEAGLSTPNPDILVEIPGGVTNVSINGFTLNGDPTNPISDTSTIRCWDDNLAFGNNIMTGWITLLCKVGDFVDVTSNRITANKAGAIFQNGPFSNLTISGNTVTPGGSPAADAQAFYMTSATTAGVTGNTATGFSGSRCIGGSSNTSITISDNTFTGCKDGVSFWGNTTFITITENDLSNSGRYGINIKGQDIVISGNKITNCGDVGINVAKHTLTTERVSITDCDLSGNTNLGLQVDTINITEIVDASGNWWGSNLAASVQTEANGGVGADYTPWLDVGTNSSTGVGFAGDFATLNVDDDSPQVGSVDRIREAVGLVSGSTVNVLAGTYTNSAQVVIDKDLVMTGAGSGITTITKSFDTSNSGDARGWFLVDTGWDFDLSGVTLDGTGQLTYQGIRNKGEGSVDDVVFTEIKYPTYSGVAIAAFGTGPVDVTNSVFSECGRIGVLYFGSVVSGSAFEYNTYTGKGVGDWLDYALDISAGAVVTVDNCVVSGCRGVASSDGSTSGAIMATTYYGAGTQALVTNCTLTDNSTGIITGYDASDGSVVEAHYNSIYGNDWGATSTGPVVDALSNWWGDSTGPLHPTLNPGGLGNAVSDSVLFDPWMTVPNVISVEPAYGITNCTTNLVYTFSITRAGAPVEARGYDVTFSINPAVVTIANPTGTGDFTELGYLNSVNGTAFYVTNNGGGSYTVSCAILGGAVGATGDGDLFSVVLTPVAEGTSPIAMSTLKFRDINNVPLTVGGVDGVVQIDCTPPLMQAIVETQGKCYNVAPSYSTFRFRDDVNLDLAEYQIDSDGWNTIFTGIDATVWSDPGWTLPGFGGLSRSTSGSKMTRGTGTARAHHNRTPTAGSS
jgi:hypothetical protein